MGLCLCVRCCIKRKIKRFTERELADMKVAFDLLDENNDGSLSLEEFEKSAAMCGQKWNIPTWQERLLKAGFDKDVSSIDFNTFVKILSHANAKEMTVDEEYRHIFEIFDKNKDGRVSADELRKTMQYVGIDLSEDVIRSIFKGDSIDYKGFCELIRKTWQLKSPQARK